MNMTTSENGARVTIRIKGELDHHEARTLARDIGRELETAMPRECVLDMSEVKFMDSSGIAVILRAYKRMEELGGHLTVENVPSQPMRVLEASGIERIIKITALRN
jgi:stage II sporulation protein AA (anti-sigma F factor antagonist)